MPLPGKILQSDISKSLFAKVIKSSPLRLLCLRDSLMRFAKQSELRRALSGTIKIPTSGIHVNGSRGIAGFTALINPFLIFIGHTPGGIRIYSLPFYINGGRSSLIPDFDVQTMLSGRKSHRFRHTELKFSVEFDIVLSFGSYENLFRFRKIQLLAEFNDYIVTIRFPEGRKKGTTLCTPVVHLVAQPDFVVTGIPYPGLGKSATCQRQCTQ